MIQKYFMALQENSIVDVLPVPSLHLCVESQLMFLFKQILSRIGANIRSEALRFPGALLLLTPGLTSLGRRH